MGDPTPPDTSPPSTHKPPGEWPCEWDEWLHRCKAAGLSARQAANLAGLTRNQVSGRMNRLFHSYRRREPVAKMIERGWESNGWDEKRLTEPWAEYRARRQAERRAKRNTHHV